MKESLPLKRYLIEIILDFMETKNQNRSKKRKSLFWGYLKSLDFYLNPQAT